MELMIYEYAYDSYGGKPIGVTDSASAVIWTRKYQDVGEFKIQAPVTERMLTLMQPGRIIRRQGLNEPGRIQTVTLTRDSHRVEMIEISGKTLQSWIGQRVISTDMGQVTDSPPNHIRRFCQTFFVMNPITSIAQEVQAYNFGSRSFAGLQWAEPDFTSALSITYQPETLSNALDSAIALMIIEGCGFRVYAQSASSIYDRYWLQLYKGVDRTIDQTANAQAVFDADMGCLLSQTFTHDIGDVKTAGYVVCQAINDLVNGTAGKHNWPIDITSTSTPYGGSTAEMYGKSGIDRDELGMTTSEVTQDDAVGSTTQAKVISLCNAVKQTGLAQLATYAEEVSFTATINPELPPYYRADFDLGDTVTLINRKWGVKRNAVVTAVKETCEQKQHEIELTFGTSSATLLNRINQIKRRRG